MECNTGTYSSPFLFDLYAEKYVSSKGSCSKYLCDNFWYVNEQRPQVGGFDTRQPGYGGWEEPILGETNNFIFDKWSSWITKSVTEKDIGAPTFSAVWPHGPHAPYVSIENYTHAYAIAEANPRSCSSLFTTTCKSFCNGGNKPNCNENCKIACTELRAHYYGSIMAVDHLVYRVVNHLKDLGIYDNSFIVFTSDNGHSLIDASNKQSWISPGTGDGAGASLRDAKFSIYEGGIRNAMIVNYPKKITQNFHSEEVTANYDFLPTVVALATGNEVDLIPPETGATDGNSLLPFLLSDTVRRDRVCVVAQTRARMCIVRGDTDEEYLKFVYPNGIEDSGATVQRVYENIFKGNDDEVSGTAIDVTCKARCEAANNDYLLFNIYDDFNTCKDPTTSKVCINLNTKNWMNAKGEGSDSSFSRQKALSEWLDWKQNVWGVSTCNEIASSGQ